MLSRQCTIFRAVISVALAAHGVFATETALSEAEPRVVVSPTVAIELPLMPIEVGETILPISLKFNPLSKIRSITELGLGWSVPLIDSVLFAVENGNLDWTGPNGQQMTFDLKLDSANMEFDPKVSIDADIASIATFGGWIYNYKSGRIKSIILPDKTRLEVSKSPSGKVTISRLGSQIFSIEKNEKEETIRIAYGKIEYLCKFDQRPITQELAGQRVVSRLEKALSEVSSGGKILYKATYSLDGDKQETAQFFSPKFQSDVVRLTTAKLDDPSSKSPRLLFDAQKGQTEQRTSNGTEIIMREFTSGLLSGKLRLKQVSFPNGDFFRYRYRYNEKAELVRIDEERNK